MSLIEVRKASFAYEGENIFEDISLKLNEGEILCLLGPNGSGKTTLLDCLLGLKKLKEGSVCLNGKDINGLKCQDIAKHIAYVPQIHNKTFPYRVIDIVLMGRAPYTSIFSSPSIEDIKIAEEALDLVGMSKFKNRPYTKLSGGEGQLVMIARALAQKTSIIVMDEPTAHLDFKHEMKIIETIIGLVKEKKLSIIMATHFPNHAFYFENNHISTRVAMMNEKKFAAFGKPTQILSEENMRLVFNIHAQLISFSTSKEQGLSYMVPIHTA